MKLTNIQQVASTGGSIVPSTLILNRRLSISMALFFYKKKDHLNLFKKKKSLLVLNSSSVESIILIVFDHHCSMFHFQIDLFYLNTVSNVSKSLLFEFDALMFLEPIQQNNHLIYFITKKTTLLQYLRNSIIMNRKILEMSPKNKSPSNRQQIVELIDDLQQKTKQKVISIIKNNRLTWRYKCFEHMCNT